MINKEQETIVNEKEKIIINKENNKREYEETKDLNTQLNKKQKIIDNNSGYDKLLNENDKDNNNDNNTQKAEEPSPKKEKKEKFRRKFGAINKETSELLDNKINEDVVDWLPPEQRDKEYNNMNAEYGY